MMPIKSSAARAVLTGLLAAGASSAAATTATATPTPPPSTAASAAADAVTQCLVKNGYPPLATGSVLVPAPTGGADPGAAASIPAAISALPAGTIPSLPPGAVPTLPPGTAPAAVPTPANVAAALQCGALLINNTMYMVVVTVTNTTTTVAAPITAAAGSISTTNEAPAIALTAPLSTATPRSSPPTTAIGQAVRARGTAGARGAVRARGSVRVRGTARRRARPAVHRHVRHLARVWLVRSAATR
ncbi:MAG: hypothetical protein QOF26_3668 [Baekduia sp.]|jgi:hypothetical protein|nr:hypothetical protein [Baekduia sp.]